MKTKAEIGKAESRNENLETRGTDTDMTINPQPSTIN
jgi:hypothetical protein